MAKIGNIKVNIAVATSGMGDLVRRIRAEAVKELEEERNYVQVLDELEPNEKLRQAMQIDKEETYGE